MATATYIAPETLYKHTGETIHVYFDFANQLTDGRSLTGTPLVTCAADNTLTISSVTITGTKVRCKVAAGTSSSHLREMKCTVDVTGGPAAEVFVCLGGIRLGDSLTG